LAELLGKARHEISEIHGKLTTRVTIERAPDAPLPRIHDFLARTRGLALVGKLGPTGKPEWDSRYTDVELKGSFDPATGQTGVKLTLLDEDPIASLRLRTTLPVATLIHHPERAEASLRDTQVSLHLAVPRRAVTSFASLPSFVRSRIPLLAGDVQLD